MRKGVHILLAFILVTASVLVSRAQDVKLNSDSLLADLNILITSFKSNHPLMYKYIGKEEFDSIAAAAGEKVKKGQSLTEFYETASVLTAQIGCGHTSVLKPVQLRKTLNERRLPFEISLIGNDIYISKALLDFPSRLNGCRISRINNTDAGELLARLYSLTSSDGYNTTHKKFIIEKNFSSLIQLALRLPSSLDMELRDEQGNTIHHTLSLDTPVVLPAPPGTGYSLTYPFSNKKAALLTIPEFDDGKREIRKYFSEIEKKKIETLVIDLRNNEGGNGNIGALLLSYLVDSSYSMIFERKMNKFIYKGHLQGSQGILLSNRYTEKDSLRTYYFPQKIKSRHHYNGQIILLVNGGTFSTAAFVTSLLRHHANATVIGEECGGNEYGLGGVVISSLELPYSKLKIRFPMYRWLFDPALTDKGHGVQPDHPVSYSIQDILNSTDLEMQKAKELAEK